MVTGRAVKGRGSKEGRWNGNRASGKASFREREDVWEYNGVSCFANIRNWKMNE